MIRLSIFLCTLLLCCQQSSATDPRYQEIIQYLQTNRIAIDSIAKVIPHDTSISRQPSLIVSDTLIEMSLSIAQLVSLKYGVDRTTSQFDSLRNIERTTVREHQKLYENKMRMEALKELVADKGTPANAVVFFSNPYGNIIIVEVLPIQFFAGSISSTGNDSTMARKLANTRLPIINRSFDFMRRFNRSVGFIFVFDKDNHIHKVISGIGQHD